MIDAALVRRMIEQQFPQWSRLPVRPVVDAGWDNRSFRLGDEMLVRLPSAAEYAGQVGKEQQWLPKLAPGLPFPIPQPLALGQPTAGYPWQWSVYAWIEGETSATGPIANLDTFAADLARFLASFQSLDPSGGPAPGSHNFHRGGSLAVYDSEVRRSISMLEQSVDTRRAIELWEAALRSSWAGPPVWVHGDISPGNLLVRDGRLAAVIDFGGIAVGDPACDLSIAWTFFSGKSRDTFVERMPADPGTWVRARGWTLWKGLVVAAGLARTTAIEWNDPMRVIESVLGQPVDA